MTTTRTNVGFDILYVSSTIDPDVSSTSYPPILKRTNGRLLVALTNGVDPVGDQDWEEVRDVVEVPAHGLVLLFTDIVLYILTTAEYARQTATN